MASVVARRYPRSGRSRLNAMPPAFSRAANQLIRGTRVFGQHGAPARPIRPWWGGSGATGPCRVWAAPTMLSAQRRRREPALASFGAVGTALLILLNPLVNERHLSESLPTLNFFYPQAYPQCPPGQLLPRGRNGGREGKGGGLAPDRGLVFSVQPGCGRVEADLVRLGACCGGFVLLRRCARLEACWDMSA
jgi:hypothetical protein